MLLVRVQQLLPHLGQAGPSFDLLIFGYLFDLLVVLHHEAQELVVALIGQFGPAHRLAANLADATEELLDATGLVDLAAEVHAEGLGHQEHVLDVWLLGLALDLIDRGDQCLHFAEVLIGEEPAVFHRL